MPSRCASMPNGQWCFDTAVTIPTENEARDHLARLFKFIEPLSRRIGEPDGFPVGLGSALQGDDAAVPPFLVSQALRSCISAAVDHLHGLCALTVETPHLHLHTPATLARGALEAAAVAIWISRPPGRDERVKRALSWFFKDVKDGNTAAVGAGMAVPTPLRERLEMLNAAAAARNLPGTVRGYTSTEAVEAANDHLNATKKTIDFLMMWRLCSGFAHGRAWPLLGFSDVARVAVPGQPDVVGVRAENTYTRVLTMAFAARLSIVAAVDLYETRARGR